MSFEEVLANCLAELEQGRSIEDCLAQYPVHAAELAPILRMITPMRSGPKPQLSLRSFARGRAAVAAHARQQQKLREPFTAASPRAMQTRAFYTSSTAIPATKTVPAKPSTAAVPPRGFLRTQRFLYPAIALMLVVALAALVRGAVTSLPGAFLYPLKSWGENTQGLLMQAAGQQASWHVNQVERRLTEFALLAQQGTPLDPTLAVAIDDHLQAALDATSAMAADQRTQFLLVWLDRLHSLQQNLPAQETTIATLSRAISTVEAAQRATTPTILPAESTPTSVPMITPTTTLSITNTVTLPTLTPTETDTPLPAVALDTPTPTPVETATAFVEAATPTVTPTPLATVPVSAPTATESPQLMPEESNSTAGSVAPGDDESSSHPEATATPTVEATSTVTPLVTTQPPHIPLPTAIEGTEEAQTPDVLPTNADETRVAATVEANQTPIPGGIPTSAEPPTPTPAEAVKNTPVATEKASTPTATKQPDPTATEKAAVPTATRVENKTPTSEATKAGTNSPTNTPKPEETKPSPSTPDSAQATLDPAETAENSDPAGQSTAEPTPTPKKKKK